MRVAGSFEDSALLERARDNVLYSLVLGREWITVINLMRLEEARGKLGH